MKRLTFTDGTAFFYVVPNQSHSNTIVKVENVNHTLIVTHECKYNCIKADIKCRHNLDAEILYKEWRWWDRFDRVEYKRGKIILLPDWELLYEPDSVESILRDVNIDVARYH